MNDPLLGALRLEMRPISTYLFIIKMGNGRKCISGNASKMIGMWQLSIILAC